MSLSIPASEKFKDELCFENDKGVKFWYDEALTDYAWGRDHNGEQLQHAVVYVVKEPDETFWYMVADKKGTALYVSKRREDIAVHLDWLKTINHFDKQKEKQKIIKPKRTTKNKPTKRASVPKQTQRKARNRDTRRS